MKAEMHFQSRLGFFTLVVATPRNNLISFCLRPLTALVLLACALTCVNAAWAQGRPGHKFVLTVINKNEKIVLTIDDLKALPQHSLVTKSPWYPGPVKFTGPLLRDVLAKLHIDGHDLEVMSLDDYKIQVPMADIQQYNVVIAHSLNDAPLPMKAKGPLMVAYPFDSQPELQSYVYYGRSVWQLNSITVR